jgi:hypothetical protein
MTDRCDISDLPVEWCACRIHKPEEKTPDVTYGRTFPARYRGRCQECEEFFDEDDRICSATDRSGYAHEECT